MWGFVSVIVGGTLISPVTTTCPWRVFARRVRLAGHCGFGKASSRMARIRRCGDALGSVGALALGTHEVPDRGVGAR